MRLVQIGDKFAIVRGIFCKEYLDMTDKWYSDTRDVGYWWFGQAHCARRCSIAPTKEYALERLAEYREYRAATLKNKPKTIKWWV